jgi:hypothetical protein
MPVAATSSAIVPSSDDPSAVQDGAHFGGIRQMAV